jgi:ketosteroid isomerase-like protein
MLTGGCLCGTVRFEIDGTLGPITCCHCSRCRRASGSAFVAAASVDRECFRVTAGEDAVSEYQSSPSNRRAFCTKCGSQLWGRHDDYPVVRVRAGGLDDDPGSRVVAHVMMGSKADWLEDGDDAVEEFSEMPPISYILPDATIAPRRAAQTRTRDNVNLVQRAYDAFARRELRAILGLLHEDVEIHQSSELPWGGDYTGHAEAAAFFGKLVQNVTSAVTLERFIDAGEHVVALGRTRGTANATGKSFDVPVAHVWTIRDGLVTRIEYHIDHPTMLAAL